MTAALRSLLLATTFVLPAAALAQDASAPSSATNPSPSFDVATIKLHPPGPLSMTGIMDQPDGINVMAMTLSMLIQQAYGLRSENQVAGLPDWAKTDRFDIHAKMSDADTMQKLTPDEAKARLQQLLQALLADRFQLKAHQVTKQVPVYDLIVAKGSPKLKDAATDTSDGLRNGPDGKPLSSFMQFLKDKTTAQGISMGALANDLSQSFSKLGRPVLDKTGLTGTYNFTLDWSPQMAAMLPGAVTDSPSEDDSTSIFTALEDLGLKLRPSTGPIDTIVIDHVERPTAD